MSRASTSIPVGALLSDHKHDSVDKDFVPPEKKLKLDDNDKDSGDNTLTHHLPVPMSCDDPKVANNDSGDNTLKPNQDLYSEENARRHFQSWCMASGVTFRDQAEQHYRFTVFKRRLGLFNLQSDDDIDDLVLLLCNKPCDSDSDDDDTEQDHIQQPKPDDKSFPTQEEEEDDFDYEDAFG